MLDYLKKNSSSEAVIWILACLGLILFLILLYYLFVVRQRADSRSLTIENRHHNAAEKRLESPQQNWLENLREGLTKTRDSMRQGLQQLFQKTKITDEILEALHELLYKADIGVKTVDKLVLKVRDNLKGQDLNWENIRALLAKETEKLLDLPSPTINAKPCVILVVGVNGVGKTTTIGKLAANFVAENKSVLIAAADTYRAAAIDQVKIWGDRLGVKVIHHQEGSDPASVAFDAVKAAISRNVDVLLIDTAGRLHNKQHLMAELSKMTRVIKKELPEAPHEVLIILDATTGQNAFLQVRAFKEAVNLTGICVTKLDGTAKGGVIIGLVDEFNLPIKYIGIGEKASDLRPFNRAEFVEAIFS